MSTDWLLYVGDSENFRNSSKHRIWGIKSETPHGKNFIKNVKPGDRLWFIKSKTNGRVIAVSTYRSHNVREFGPILNLSLTNEELGWKNGGSDSDTEIHYTDLYGVDNCELLTHIKGASPIRKYNENCRVDLAVEYTNIVRYSKVTTNGV